MGLDKKKRAIVKAQKESEKRENKHRSNQQFDRLIREGRYDEVDIFETSVKLSRKANNKPFM